MVTEVIALKICLQHQAPLVVLTLQVADIMPDYSALLSDVNEYM